MKQQLFATLFLLICVIFPLTTQAQVVDIPDLNLRAAIESELNKESGELITAAALTNLTELRAPNADISNLTGLEFATNLTKLDLEGEWTEETGWINSNNISDLTPLAGLTKLTTLNLSRTNVSDLTPLAGLTKLTTLELHINPTISNLKPLAGLTNLTFLHLLGADVSDISPLANLTNLQTLLLGGNNISDLSPLENLTNLTRLGLGSNNFSDISPLANLTNLETLGLGNNHNNISDFSPLAGLINLTKLSLRHTNISDLSHLTRLTNLAELNLSGRYVSDISPLVENTGLGEGDKLRLEGNNLNLESLITHIPILIDKGVRVEYDIPLIDLTASVTIPDEALHAAIQRELRKEPDEMITANDMVRLRWFNASRRDNEPAITNLTGLEFAINLETINFYRHNITDISPLQGLPKLRSFGLNSNNITNDSTLIPTLSNLTHLNYLSLQDNNITDLSILVSTLSNLTNLTDLNLSGNNLTDISPLATLADLTGLWLENNAISDISPLTSLTNLRSLFLLSNPVTDISPLSELPNLRSLSLPNLDNISALKPVLSDLTNLERLSLSRLNITDLSPLIPALSSLPNLSNLDLWGNLISDISPLAELTNLIGLNLGGNSISDISALAHLTNLVFVGLGRNPISDISPLAGLTNLNFIDLSETHVSDISPLTEITGLETADWSQVFLWDTPLSYQSIHKHIPTLENKGVFIFDSASVPHVALMKVSGDNQDGATLAALSEPFIVEIQDEAGAPLPGVSVEFTITRGDGTLTSAIATTDTNGRAESTLTLGPNLDALNTVKVTATGIRSFAIFNAIPKDLQFTLSLTKGTSLIHVPLKATAVDVDGEVQTIKSIADLYKTLGGASAVNFLITYDSQNQEWVSYFGPLDTDADRALTDDMGIMANMTTDVSVQFRGNPLGTDGKSTITLNKGLNLVGLPLRDESITRVSSLLDLDGIRDNVPLITLIDDRDFKSVGRADDPGDIDITGGQGFLLIAQQPATVTISGEAWTNTSATAAPPSLSLKGIAGRDTTPVLALRGSVVDEDVGLDKSTFRVTVKNLSTGRAVTDMTKDEGSGYRLTVVDIETARAATVGDILEISAQSPNSFIGVEPLRYTVTAEDVKRSLIELPALVVYEIPAETKLLRNYPNPFNPETWIPYRLAEDASVTLTIYDQTGKVVRTIDMGHQIAAVYEDRSKAIYWDGRNNVGETVASGVYFYHLSAGDYSATRKMVILK